MDDDAKELNRLIHEGGCCAGILLEMGLSLLGERNPQLVHAVSGLCNGLHSGLICGALAGGCCMLTLFAEGKEETAELSKELVDWFAAKYGVTYGGMDCLCMTNNVQEIKRDLCPSLIEATYRQAKAILLEYGKISAG